MRKLLVTLITAMMILTFSIPATVGAAETTTGSITISGASEDNTYTIYKMMDLLSYNESGEYSYQVVNEWREFFSTGAGKDYIDMDGNGYVKWKAEENDSVYAAFAKAAMAYVDSKKETASIQPVGSQEGTGSDLVFGNLALGYYLIDSTMGSLCGLTTTNPNAALVAKNGSPTIDKQVQEDSTGNWGSTNTADIGQKVNFRTTINVHQGAQNYVLHDVMAKGLTFTGEVKVTHLVPVEGAKEVETPSKYYKVVTDGLTDGCTFEVQFTNEFCDHINTNDKVFVYYSAVLNEKAVIAAEGNVNKTWLDYGENHKTEDDQTITYAYAFDLVKTNDQGKLLSGATFEIYDQAEGGNALLFVMENGTYRRAAEGESGVSAIDVIGGNVRVSGLDNGKYYLEEITPPEGYNPITTRQEFTISDGNLDATFTQDDIYATGSGVQVVNKTGSVLPETGGFGTTMMLLFGGFVVLAAAVVLFVRKRMSQYAE